MRMLPVLLVLAAGLLCSRPLPPLAAEESVDAGRIARLIGQLGHNSYFEREDASRALEEVGPPALEALHKAVASPDLEVRRRAEDLLYTIARRVEADRILKPKYVRLACQDTPVPEAVARLSQLSGYTIALDGDARKWAARKVTLDTGSVAFWQALDLLCRRAGLTEAAPPAAPGVNVTGAQAVPALPVLPVVPAPLNPPLVIRRTTTPVTTPGNHRISLVDGPAVAGPSDLASVFRVRAVPGTPDAPAGADRIALTLEARAEPRLFWRTSFGLQVRKALDDQGQTLTAVTEVQPALPQVGVASALPRTQPVWNQQRFQVWLKPGEKPARALKELHGVIPVQVQLESEELVRVDNVRQSANKTFRGPGGVITVLEFSRQDDGQSRVRFQLTQSPEAANAVAANLAMQRVVIQARGGVAVTTTASRPMSLLDARGHALLTTSYSLQLRAVNNVFTQEITIVARPQQGQGEPDRLVYSGPRTDTVDVPFVLKDVPLTP